MKEEGGAGGGGGGEHSVLTKMRGRTEGKADERSESQILAGQRDASGGKNGGRGGERCSRFEVLKDYARPKVGAYEPQVRGSRRFRGGGCIENVEEGGDERGIQHGQAAEQIAHREDKSKKKKKKKNSSENAIEAEGNDTTKWTYS